MFELDHAFGDITQEHVEELSHLWLQRDYAIRSSKHSYLSIEKLQRRIQKHITAIESNLEEACHYSWHALGELSSPGEFFTASLCAFMYEKEDSIDSLVRISAKNEKASRGLISALGWLPALRIKPWIKSFLDSDDIHRQFLGLAVCSVHRIDPGSYLALIISSSHFYENINLSTRALRLVGELKRNDLSEQVLVTIRESLSKKEANPKIGPIHFWASWTALILGLDEAVDQLKMYVFTLGPYQARAIDTVFRYLPLERAVRWINTLKQDIDQQRQVIYASKVMGDPRAINSLITLMEQPLLARIAGEAFSMITGIDIEKNDLNRKLAPKEWLAMEEQVESAINTDLTSDDKDIVSKGKHDASAPDEERFDKINPYQRRLWLCANEDDGDLCWPDPQKVARHWQQSKASFTEGRRYLMGEEIDPSHLHKMISHGGPHERRAAAIELAQYSDPARTINPSSPFYGRP